MDENEVAQCYLSVCVFPQSYIHGSSQAQFVAETHIVLLFSILQLCKYTYGVSECLGLLNILKHTSPPMMLF